jgi:hypothetical protein
MQANGDIDLGDRDHVWIAGGIPPWGNFQAIAGGLQEGFYVDSLQNEITPAQWDAITSIDYVELHIVASVTPSPYNPESIVPMMRDNEAGDPQYPAQDGVGHELVWRLTTNPNSPYPWMKGNFASGGELEWGFANGNAIGPNRPGGIFVHSMQVYVSYH